MTYDFEKMSYSELEQLQKQVNERIAEREVEIQKAWNAVIKALSKYANIAGDKVGVMCNNYDGFVEVNIEKTLETGEMGVLEVSYF